MNKINFFCIVSGVFLFLIVSNQGLAQTMRFLPTQTWAVRSSVSLINYTNYADSLLHRRSTLDYLVERENNLQDTNLKTEQFTGSASVRQIQQQVDLQYGVMSYLNLLMQFSVATNKRTSNIKAIAGSKAVAQEFASKYATKSNNSLDMLSLDFLFRPMYSDATDLQVGVGYEYRGGSLLKQAEAINNGLNQIRLQLHVINYLYSYRMWFRHNVDYKLPLSKKENYNGKKIAIAGGDNFMMGTSAFYGFSKFFTGLHIQLDNKNAVKVDSKTYDLHSVALNGEMIFGLGNLNQLEDNNNDVTLPWDAQVSYKFILLGRNTPLYNTLTLQASVYF